jgi:hypothetical protein
MRIVILSSIISPLPSARWRSSPNVCHAAQKGPVLVSSRLQTMLHFTTESGSKSSHFHGLSLADGS